MADSLERVPRKSLDTPAGFRLVLGPPAAVEDAFLGRVAAVRAALAARADRRARRRRAPAAVPAAADRRHLARSAQRPLLDARRARAPARRADASPRRGGGRCPRSPSARYTAEAARGCTGYFAPVAATPGFAEVARRLLRELRREGISPDALERVAPGSRRVRGEGRRPRRPLPPRARRQERLLRRRGRARRRRPRPLRRRRAAASSGSGGSARTRAALVEAIAARAAGDRVPADRRAPTPTRRTRELRAWLARRRAHDVERLDATDRRDDARASSRRGSSRPPAPIALDGTRRARLGARPARRGARGRARVPRLGERGDRVPRDGGHLPAGRGLPAARSRPSSPRRGSPSTSTTARRSPSGRSAGASSRCSTWSTRRCGGAT